MSNRLYNWQELNNPPAGEGVAGMVQSGRNAICGLYHRAPWMFTTLFPDSPIGQLQKTLMDKVCPMPSPPSMPQPSSPPFSAQCPIRYRVGYTWEVPGNPNIPGPQSGTVIVLGPISGGSFRSNSSGTIAWGIQGGVGSGGGDGWVGVVATANDASAKGFTGSITSATAIDSIPPGGCGTAPQPRQYPNPFLPDANDFVGPPGPGSPTPGPGGPLAPPIVRPPQFPSIPIPIPVLFKPYIGVDVGPFNFNFDLGGLTFNLRPDIDINFNFGSGGGTPLPPGVQPRPPLPPAEGGECDLSGVISLVSATRSELAQRITEQTGILQPQEAPLVWTQLTAPADSGMAQLPLNSVAVRFEMTDRPFNKKAMSGNGGSPDVTYAGWALFGGANVDGGERIPLDYESTRIYVPPNATHVGWTCKDGRRASVSVGVFQPTDANLKLGRNLLWQAKI